MGDRRASSKDETGENACVICFKRVDIYSLGQCDHPVCFECSTRMRVLCRQNECPICRQDLPKVIFTRRIEPFERIQTEASEVDAKYKIVFLSKETKDAFDDLLTHECPECRKTWPNFNHLRDHVRRAHQLTYCDLCVDNLKILTSERRCYTRKELAEHRRHGDPNDRSHRGHPLCKFCETRYMDNDELYRHVRRDHLFCHFCDADGIHQYYKTYDSLRDHFRSEHFLCEEGECYMEKFTSAFRTEIDLKAHKANEHGKILGKAGVKQARTLDIEFSLSSRPRAYIRRNNYRGGGGGGEGHSSNYQEDEEAEIVAPAPAPQRQPNTDCREEFPTLGGGAAPAPSHKLTATVRSSRPPGYEEFPALPSTTTTEATLSLRVDSTDRPAPSSANFSIQVNHPRFTTTLTASKVSSNDHTYNYHFPALDLNGAPSGGAGPSNQPRPNQAKDDDWTKIGGKKKDVPKAAKQVPKTYSNPDPNPPKLEDFPALAPKAEPKPVKAPSTKSTASNTSDVQPSKSKKKKSKSKQEAVGTNVKKKTPEKPHPQTSNKENVGKNEDKIDFPALGGSSKAPPGFEVKWAPKRPPPGLAPPPQTPAPPPGFAAMNGAAFPPLGNQGHNPGEYLPPPNFEKRNNALVDKVAKALHSDSWMEFKEISTAFRTEIVSPEAYYKHCRSAMADDTFSQLFPELLALLPDIGKQEQLWTLYSEDKEADKSSLKKCAVCGQVVRSGDFQEHYKRHNLDNHFPPFMQKQTKKKHNAWAK